MDRSSYTALVGLFQNRPRDLAISRAELRQRLIELCGIDLHIRDIQDLVNQVALQENWCIISETRGYWRLDVNAGAGDLLAAKRAVNILRAHAESELTKAHLLERHVADITKAQESRLPRRQTPPGLPRQTGLFT